MDDSYTPMHRWIAEKLGVAPSVLSRRLIDEYQLSRLRETLALAKRRSRFYGTLLADTDENALSSLEELSRLPFTMPADISRDAAAFVCTGISEITRIVSLYSSGTTGRKKRIFFTREDQELTIDFFDHGMRNIVSHDDRVMILMPFAQEGSVGALLSIGLERLGALPLPFGPVFEPEQAIEAALERGATSMVGIPTHVLAMARSKHGAMLAGRIKSVLLSADNVPASICRVLERVWGCEVYNHYGMTEMGLGGGVETSPGSGYQLREADLLFEIVDPQTGAPVPDGQYGEIVFSTLTRRGMPLIRYRTGDISRFLPSDGVLRRMDIVRGRADGAIKHGDLSLSLVELDDMLFSLEGVLDYRVMLCAEERLCFIVRKAEDAILCAETVEAAIMTIRAVSELFAGRVNVSVSTEPLPVSNGMVKRRIEREVE